MTLVSLWLFACACWAAVAWLAGASVLLMTLPYWGVPVALLSFFVAVEGLAKFNRWSKQHGERLPLVDAPQRRDYTGTTEAARQ